MDGAKAFAAASLPVMRPLHAVLAARPSAVGAPVTLNFAPNWQDTWNATAQRLNEEWFLANWKTKSIRVNINAPIQSQASAQIAATLAGTGYMDVFQDCCADLTAWQSKRLLMPLNDLFKEYEIDAPALWSGRHLQVLNYGGQQVGVPAYDGPGTVFYRQDILEELNLPLPDANWTAADLQRLARAATVKTSKTGGRTGFYLRLYMSNWWSQLTWLVAGWGGQQMNAAHTQALMNSDAAVNMATFVQDGATGGWLGRGIGVVPLAQGTCVFHHNGGWELLAAVLLLGTQVKWDILPAPVWPGGRSTFSNNDFYSINAATKHPREAWELFRFVTVDPAYQRWQMRTTLVEPGLLSLWDEWEETVRASAPVLRTKQIQWIREAALGDYAWPNQYFRYHPTTTDNLMDTWMDKVWYGQVSPPLAMRQMTSQINAAEKAGTEETV